MKTNPRWWEIEERTSVFGIRLLLGLYRLFGRTPFRIALGPVLLFYWVSSPSLRRASLGWLDRVGFLGRPAGHADGLRHLTRFAETVLDKFALQAGEPTDAELTIHGDEPFRTDAPTQGCVILTSHAGCQEFLARSSALHTEHPIVVLQHTRHAEAFERLLRRAGAKPSRIRFREVGELSPALAMELDDLVREGAYVVVAGDRAPVASRALARVPFFGREAPFPTGGALLSLLLKCPLRQMTCTRTRPTAPGRVAYRVRFESLDECPQASRREREAYLKRVTERYAANLEAELRRSPYDWFNFFDFWAEADGTDRADRERSL